MYAPDPAANLLSVSQLISKYTVVFDRNGFQVFNNENVSVKGKIFFTGQNIGGIYKLYQPIDNLNSKKPEIAFLLPRF